VTYFLAVGRCIGSFAWVLRRPQHWHFVDAPLIIMLARFVLDCLGVLRKDDGFKFALYGLECCSAGEFAARLGGPTQLCLGVMALGIVLPVLKFFTGPKPGRIPRPKPA